MAAKKDSNQKGPAAKKAREENIDAKYLIAALVIILVVFIGAFLYVSTSRPTFANFRSAFDGAPYVSIYVQYHNASFFINATGCATALIQRIVANYTMHRNASNIYFFVINETSCVYRIGLGSAGGNEINATAQTCLNYTKSMPGIMLAYSPTNSTKVEGKILNVSGSSSYLELCGIESELP